MPLSEHEQRILEDIERRLAEEDPQLARVVSSETVYSHLARRIRLAALSFLAGFAMLWLFFLWPFVAFAGFLVMLGSGLIVYHYLRRLGRDQIQNWKRGGRFSITGVLARLADRLRGPGPQPRDS